MARQIQVLLVDDLDGTKADRTVSFGLEGDQYEIDLSQANIDKLQDALAKYVEAARKVRPTRARRTGSRQGGTPGKSALVREWARARGMKVSERGRVSQEIIDAYEAAH